MNQPMIRSFLFVPGDSARKFDRASQGPADALILDLEDSVAQTQKAAAREATAQMLSAPRAHQMLWVRVNALDSGLTLADLVAVMPHRPDGIVLPKCSSAADLQRLDHYLDAFEATANIEPGRTRILSIATETAQSLFALGDYSGCSPRLWGMMWGGEDLAAALGAYENRDATGFHGPYRLARDLCLAGARAAGVVPVDTVFVDTRDLEGLRTEALQARRDGFGAKAVIHPSHVEVVHAAFMPAAADVDWARRVLAAVEAAPGVGVVTLDGKMIDQPHATKAQQILALAQQVGAQPVALDAGSSAAVDRA